MDKKGIINMNINAQIYNDIERILFTKEQIHKAVEKLGNKITKDYAGKEPICICILKGASIFFADLIREIDLPLSIEHMAISSYGNSTNSSGEVRLIKDIDRSIHGKDVIIVEDIVDTGTTLNYLKKILSNRGASSVKIASLLDKPARRKVDIAVEYSCFETPDEFVVGYGLDYAEKYRNIPDVCVLKKEIYN